VDPTASIDFGITVDDLHSLEAMLDRQADYKFRIRYPHLQSIGRWDLTDRNFLKIEAILKLCFDVGQMTIVIDEVDTVCSPYGIPPTFRRLLARGRHDSLNLIWTARRPQEVSKLLLSQTDEFFLFGMHHNDDVDYFQKFMQFNRDDVLNLKVGESLHWAAGESTSQPTAKKTGDVRL